MNILKIAQTLRRKKFSKIWLIITFLILIIMPATLVKAESNEYYALILGISDYQPAGPGGPDLNYADDDANDLYQTLITEHNWKQENIIKLIDSQATKSEIQNSLNNLAARENSNDLFLFYFAGHGSYTLDQPPIDEVDGFDEYILTHDQEEILDDELTAMLEILDSKKIVVIIDACFSGGFFKSSDLETRTVPGPEPKELIDTLNGDLAKQGYIVLSASDDDETCAESTILQNGVFTFYLIEGMTTTNSFPADLDNDDKVSAEEAYAYAAPKATNFNPNQHAQIWDAITGEAELTILPRIIIGGVLMPSNKLRIIKFYSVLIIICGILSIAFCKSRRILK
jgi:uncharacterized caspase-like protein